MNYLNNNPIGVFDSGVGGLTCLKELKKLLPNEDIIYLGDTARVPYGTKSRETIAEYAKQDIAFLEKYNVKMILIACGTVSSVLMTEDLFSKSNTELFSGVIYPAVKSAFAATRNNRIGVIGTPATIRSGCYGKALRELCTDIKVVGKACPLFVPLVENGYTDRENEITRLVAKEYLDVMIKEKVDTLIMGCTHYPLLKDVFEDILGDKVTLISPGAEVARHAVKVLMQRQLLCDKETEGVCRLFCTDSEELFSENVSAFLEDSINAEISKCSL